MSRPSNKELAVLAFLRESGELTCKSLAEGLRDRTICLNCNGTGEIDSARCRLCYGWGKASFWYSDAYQALKNLQRRGLVSRRPLLNEWGDETRSFVWRSVGEGVVPSDELEALYLLPAKSEAKT